MPVAYTVFDEVLFRAVGDPDLSRREARHYAGVSVPDVARAQLHGALVRAGACYCLVWAAV